MKNKFGLLGVLMVALFAGCKQVDVDFYGGGSKLLFERPWEGDVAYSFIESATLAEEKVELKIPIKWIGVSDTTIQLHYSVQLEATDLSPIGYEGAHKSLAFTMEEKQRTDTLIINCRRVAFFQDTVYSVRISFDAVNEEQVDFQDGVNVGLVKELEIAIDDEYKMPDYWPEIEPIVGPFSSRKFRVLAKSLRMFNSRIDAIFQDVHEVVQNTADFAIIFQEYLDESAALGDPIYERNGERMKAGALAFE